MLRQVYPEREISFLRDVVITSKNHVDSASDPVNVALDLIHDERPDHLDSVKKALTSLGKQLPTCTRSHALAVFIEARGSLYDASSRLEEQLKANNPSEYIKYFQTSSPSLSHPQSLTPTHVNGVPQSFIYSNRAVRTIKPDTPTLKFFKVGSEAMARIDNRSSATLSGDFGVSTIKEEEDEEDMVDDDAGGFEETFEPKVDQLYQIFNGRGASIAECEKAIRSCDNSTNEAFMMLNATYDLLDKHDFMEVSGLSAGQRFERRDTRVAGHSYRPENIGKDILAEASNSPSSFGQKRGAEPSLVSFFFISVKKLYLVAENYKNHASGLRFLFPPFSRLHTERLSETSQLIRFLYSTNLTDLSVWYNVLVTTFS